MESHAALAASSSTLNKQNDHLDYFDIEEKFWIWRSEVIRSDFY